MLMLMYNLKMLRTTYDKSFHDILDIKCGCGSPKMWTEEKAKPSLRYLLFIWHFETFLTIQSLEP